ncbi:hypothetical protein OG618_37490 (plasmid) [Kitasatospora sp. NBC_01246]|uniref:hypothetical protein n=1 Tax=Kitasatospora sp. NBC_01246 TaxID=2903570 RepID=UPI002E30A183|nr:hypothetical protein [Kitasatospora sp. NBC_01246]
MSSSTGSSFEPTSVEQVHDMWLGILEFLGTNATNSWSFMMDRGIGFVMPPQVRSLPTSHARASALAQAEFARLAGAQLFHLDASAGRAADQATLRAQNLVELAPSPSGLIVWEEAPYTVAGGIPIRAVSWGIAYDGGTWMSWWSDNAATVRAGLSAPESLGLFGRLMFHEEAHLPPKGWPAQAETPGDRSYPAYRSLLSAWTAIDSGTIEEAEASEAIPAVRKSGKRLGITVPAVRRLRAATAASAAVTTPDVIIRRVLAGTQITGRPYPGTLPDELAPWHCYTADGGHSLLVMLDPMNRGERVTAGHEATTLSGVFVPAPVKAVLRAGWRIQDGYVHTPLRYDSTLGLLTNPEDDEFDLI